MKHLSLAMILPVCALCFLSLVYGALSVHLGWWPSAYIQNAKNAAVALLATQDEELGRNWPTSMERIETSGHCAVQREHDRGRSGKYPFKYVLPTAHHQSSFGSEFCHHCTDAGQHYGDHGESW